MKVVLMAKSLTEGYGGHAWLESGTVVDCEPYTGWVPEQYESEQWFLVHNPDRPRWTDVMSERKLRPVNNPSSLASLRAAASNFGDPEVKIS